MESANWLTGDYRPLLRILTVLYSSWFSQ